MTLDDVKDLSDAKLVQLSALYRTNTKNEHDRLKRYKAGKTVEVIEKELRTRRFGE